jgi:hypothetical protein
VNVVSARSVPHPMMHMSPPHPKVHVVMRVEQAVAPVWHPTSTSSLEESRQRCRLQNRVLEVWTQPLPGSQLPVKV